MKALLIGLSILAVGVGIISLLSYLLGLLSVKLFPNSFLFKNDDFSSIVLSGLLFMCLTGLVIIVLVGAYAIGDLFIIKK